MTEWDGSLEAGPLGAALRTEVWRGMLRPTVVHHSLDRGPPLLAVADDELLVLLVGGIGARLAPRQPHCEANLSRFRCTVQVGKGVRTRASTAKPLRMI